MKTQVKSIIVSLLITIILAAIGYYFFLPVINIKSVDFWISVSALIIVYILSYEFCLLIFHAYKYADFNSVSHKPSIYLSVVLILLVVAFGLCNLFTSPLLHAKRYASLLKVNEDCDFNTDLSQTLSSDAIAIMDTSSARKLGNRKLGSLNNLVSQYNVSNDYTQISYDNSPAKVSALEYAGFFKYMKNKKSGIPGYVLVSPVDMSAEYVTLNENMKYVPSAYFSHNLMRTIRFAYPTKMIYNAHFEIDEEGIPYYVASVYDNKIGIFGGRDVSGVVTVNPVDGSTSYYKISEIPDWIDLVYDGDLICSQYNYYGTLQKGYWNSKLSAVGCKVTTDDYGYIAMDNDIWIYTGVTSVNSDASNIGFILANERTKEANFYTIAGADEASAQTAAEGEVQQYGYKASFPSLINIDGYATYIMVLKDSGGLVKMYAAVNAEQYNIVTTASTQKECIEKYKRRMSGGIDSALEEESLTTDQQVTSSQEEIIDESLFTEQQVTIKKLEQIVVNGNTYIYLLTTEDALYHAKYVDVLPMINVSSGDTLTIRVYNDQFLCEN